MKSKKKKKKITIKDIIRLIVLLVAFSVLLYPTFSSYLNEKNGSKVVSYYDEESVKLSKAEKEQMLEDARAYNKEMLGNIDLIDPFSQEDVEIDARYESLLNVDGSGMMGYIRIPKINIELPIYHGTSEAVLLSQHKAPLFSFPEHTARKLLYSNSFFQFSVPLVRL